MIINKTDSHEATYIGEIKENKVGIETSNIDFIATLLTSNLYSKPFESFLRETVANAYDSCIEAGNKNKIIMLLEYVSDSKIKISIRDYGTGLSPERFDRVYRNIGSSTKRESNDYIGMFGIGSFSCLSVAEVVNITSYYEGIKYSYVMYKNGKGINIDEVNQEQGDYKNGLEISLVTTKPTSQNFRNAIRSLSLFETLYIKEVDSEFKDYWISAEIETFNSRKILKRNTFSLCNLLTTKSGSVTISVGKILYKIPDTYGIDNTNAIIDIPLGEVDITPNREALQFTEFTENTLKSYIKKAKEEIQDLFYNIYRPKNSSITYKELLYLNEALRDSDIEIPLTDDIKLSYSRDALNINKIIEGIDFKGLNLTSIESLTPFRYLRFSDESIFSYKDPTCHNRNYTNYIKTWVGLESVILSRTRVPLREVTKAYLNDKYKNYILIFEDELTTVKEAWKKYLKNYDLDVTKLDAVTEGIIEDLNITPITNEDVPEDFKKNFKASKTKKVKNVSNISTRVYVRETYRVMSLESLLSRKNRVLIYTINTKDDQLLRNLSVLSSYLPIYFISVEKKTVEILKNRKKFIPLEEFLLKRNKIFSKLATYVVIKDAFKKLITEAGLSWDYNKNIPIIQKFESKYNAYARVPNYAQLKDIITLYVNNNWLIEEDIKYFSLSKEEVEKYKQMKKIKDNRDFYIDMLISKKIGFNTKLMKIHRKYYYENI